MKMLPFLLNISRLDTRSITTLNYSRVARFGATLNSAFVSIVSTFLSLESERTLLARLRLGVEK